MSVPSRAAGKVWPMLGHLGGRLHQVRNQMRLTRYGSVELASSLLGVHEFGENGMKTHAVISLYPRLVHYLKTAAAGTAWTTMPNSVKSLRRRHEAMRKIFDRLQQGGDAEQPGHYLTGYRIEFRGTGTLQQVSANH